MGLDVSHDCWSGSYGRFMGFRREIAKTIGLPPLDLMEGFWGAPMSSFYIKEDAPFYNSLPISWDCLKEDPIYELLYHSDCEGEIEVEKCIPIAKRLEEIAEMMEDDNSIKSKALQFAKGLREAAEAKENVEFC